MSEPFLDEQSWCSVMVNITGYCGLACLCFRVVQSFSCYRLLLLTHNLSFGFISYFKDYLTSVGGPPMQRPGPPGPPPPGPPGPPGPPIGQPPGPPGPPIGPPGGGPPGKNS